MIFNPIKIYKLKQEAEINNWLTSWVQRCLDDPNISFAGKVQLLSGYYSAQSSPTNVPKEED